MLDLVKKFAALSPRANARFLKFKARHFFDQWDLTQKSGARPQPAWIKHPPMPDSRAFFILGRLLFNADGLSYKCTADVTKAALLQGSRPHRKERPARELATLS